jgi:hypothetical protein
MLQLSPTLLSSLGQTSGLYKPATGVYLLHGTHKRLRLDIIQPWDEILDLGRLTSVKKSLQKQFLNQFMLFEISLFIFMLFIMNI